MTSLLRALHLLFHCYSSSLLLDTAAARLFVTSAYFLCFRSVLPNGVRSSFCISSATRGSFRIPFAPAYLFVCADVQAFESVTWRACCLAWLTGAVYFCFDRVDHFPCLALTLALILLILSPPYCTFFFFHIFFHCSARPAICVFTFCRIVTECLFFPIHTILSHILFFSSLFLLTPSPS